MLSWHIIELALGSFVNTCIRLDINIATTSCIYLFQLKMALQFPWLLQSCAYIFGNFQTKQNKKKKVNIRKSMKTVKFTTLEPVELLTQTFGPVPKSHNFQLNYTFLHLHSKEGWHLSECSQHLSRTRFFYKIPEING